MAPVYAAVARVISRHVLGRRSHRRRPGADLSLVVILAVLAAFSFAAVRMLRQYFNAHAEVAA
jgi:uncharacterized membrane protein